MQFENKSNFYLSGKKLSSGLCHLRSGMQISYLDAINWLNFDKHYKLSVSLLKTFLNPQFLTLGLPMFVF